MIGNEKNIEKYLLKKAPATVYYIPDFISREEESHLLNKIYSTPKPKWTQLSNRRLQNWGGIPHPKGMIAEKLPNWLDLYLDRIIQLGVFETVKPNHVLINEYTAGQGIMPHFDGDLYYPTIATISCGSHTLLNFYEPDKTTDGNEVCSIFVDVRSLVILQDDMYKKYVHGIVPKTEDTLSSDILNICSSSPNQVLNRSTRVSLTIRHVPRTTKFSIKT
uniref:Alpha-ketoglutarate-dependent dioxygenase alkB homolog 6 n=1 Tax=Cacopsylla melanoneura TaxID=428564 RepID=A0A8D8XDX0_9HEMI